MWHRAVVRHWSATLVVGIWTALVAAGALDGTAAAHGGGTPQLSDVAAGPYRLFVWTQPEPWRAGEVHVTVAVILPAESGAGGVDRPVIDAAVTIGLTGPAGEDYQVDAAPPALLSNPTYEADARPPTSGPWQITVAVAGQEGAGGARFTVDVLPARTVNWALLAGGVAALVVITGAMVIYSRRTVAAPARIAGVRRSASHPRARREVMDK